MEAGLPFSFLLLPSACHSEAGWLNKIRDTKRSVEPVSEICVICLPCVVEQQSRVAKNSVAKNPKSAIRIFFLIT